MRFHACGEDIGAKLPHSQHEQKKTGFTQNGVPAAYTHRADFEDSNIPEKVCVKCNLLGSPFLCSLSPVIIHSPLTPQEGSTRRFLHCSECIHWGNEGEEEKDRGHRASWYPGEASPFSDKKRRESGGRGCKSGIGRREMRSGSKVNKLINGGKKTKAITN